MNSLQKFHQPFVDFLGGSNYCATVLLKFEYSDLGCIKLLISKLLGVGIVAGGAILKLPQIAKIMSSRSVAGISFISYLLDTLCYTITVAYNQRNGNAWTTYGESIFITFQNLFILALLMLYKNNFPGLILLAAIFLIASYSLFDATITDPWTLIRLQWSTVFISAAAKLPQIYINFKNKSTGALSVITVGLQFVGSAARIFTTIQEVNDDAVLAGFLIATGLNGVLAAQVVWFNYFGKKVAKKGKGKKKN